MNFNVKFQTCTLLGCLLGWILTEIAMAINRIVINTEKGTTDEKYYRIHVKIKKNIWTLSVEIKIKIQAGLTCFWKWRLGESTTVKANTKTVFDKTRKWWKSCSKNWHEKNGGLCIRFLFFDHRDMMLLSAVVIKVPNSRSFASFFIFSLKCENFSSWGILLVRTT